MGSSFPEIIASFIGAHVNSRLVFAIAVASKSWIQLTGIARNVPEMCPKCEIIPTVIVTSFAGSSLLFFVFFVDFARKSELLSDPFLALYDHRQTTLCVRGLI